MSAVATPNPVAVITGASSGIGRALAHRFAADGHACVLVARRETLLKELATELAEAHDVEAHVVAADLADPVAPERIARWITDADRHVTHLVNNAGFGSHGPFVEGDPDGQRDMIAVNVSALTALTRTFLPPMIERGHGRVLNVASTAAYQPGPYMAVYYATKAYVLNFSVALALEVEGSGVTVTALCPGPTQTGFADRAGIGDDSKIFSDLVTMDAEDVARTGYDAMCRGERIVVPGAANRLLASFAHLVPRPLSARIVGALQDDL